MPLLCYLISQYPDRSDGNRKDQSFPYQAKLISSSIRAAADTDDTDDHTEVTKGDIHGERKVLHPHKNSEPAIHSKNCS